MSNRRLDDDPHPSIHVLKLARVTQVIGTGVLTGGLLTVALLAAMGVTVVLIAMIGQVAFEGGILVLMTFGFTATMVSKLLRLF